MGSANAVHGKINGGNADKKHKQTTREDHSRGFFLEQTVRGRSDCAHGE